MRKKARNGFLLLLIFLLLLCAVGVVKAHNRGNEKHPEGIHLKPRNKDYNHVSFIERNGECVISTKGNDPYVFFDAPVSVDFEKQHILSFESFNASGAQPLVIFVGNQLDWDHLAEGYVIPHTEGWSENGYDLSIIKKSPASPFTSVRIRFGQTAGKTIRIRNVQLREPTEQEKRMALEQENRERDDSLKACRIRNYLSHDFDAEIVSVKASYHNRRIEIAGRLHKSEDNHADEIGLVEVPLWNDVTDLKMPATYIPLTADSFRTRVGRIAEDGHDRLLSGWAIVRLKNDTVHSLLSPLHYVDEIIPRKQLAKKVPHSLKGLGGCPFYHPDMRDLGIASVTFNIILDQILSTNYMPGYESYHYGGKTWYVDMRGAVKAIDEQVGEANKNDWMVSAILLVPVCRDIDSETWLRQVAHPDALGSAAFSLPDMTSEDAVEAYATTINFLTERYSTPEHGRIHHWIIHNEIQNGYFWTSAGNKRIETYMDLYQRSMRLVQTLARQYDPNAKTLISLDHDWTAMSDMRGYKGLDLLELLVDYSNKEGNFEWGIAFHPYPQDINNPRTWKDDLATFDLETPYITPRNLEVIDQWASLERVGYLGKSREIQFTEQGLNSPDYSPESLAAQAAGLAYTWEKLKGLKNATAYQYHLWADAHEEGGLKLGLRKYHDAEGDPYGKKPIWFLYQAIDTPGYETARDKYLRIIGLNSWDEIRCR